MSSSKCPNCGLVNFSTAIQCKRCRQFLNELAPMATERSYQTPTQNFQPYQMPPPPPVFHGNQYPTMPPTQTMPMNCIKCGDRNNLALQTFKRDYVPPACYLGMFIGLLPMAILVAIFKVTHHITAPFCGGCWKKFSRVNLYETLSTLFFFVGFIVAIFAAFALESGLAFFAVFALTIGVIVSGQVYKKKHSPKFKRIDKREVVIDAPLVGEISFLK